MTIEPIGTYRSTWGEGPIWSNERLIYVDIESHLVISLDPVTGAEQSWNVGERVGTVIPRKKGGFVIAGDHGFSFLNPENGQVTPISDPEQEKRNNRFNDGKCSPDGYFFAGSISLVKQTGDADLYRLSPDLEVTKAYGPVTNSNGIVWSADGNTAYYIDTPTKEILAFDYADGLLTNPQVALSTAALESSPDGMTIDEDGNLWVAFCHGGCVVCYDPTTGNEVRKVEIPCLETTACTFGGANLDELYVTTGIHKTEKEEHAGLVMVVKGLGVKGLKSHEFEG